MSLCLKGFAGTSWSHVQWKEIIILLASFLQMLHFFYQHIFNHQPFFVSFTALFNFSPPLIPPLPSFSLSLPIPPHFFHYFIPFFTSSPLSPPLFISLHPLRLHFGPPAEWRPIQFHPLPIKQGLKFKAAVVGWQQMREHWRWTGQEQNRLKLSHIDTVVWFLVTIQKKKLMINIWIIVSSGKRTIGQLKSVLHLPHIL